MSLCLEQLYAQALRPMPLDLDAMTTNAIDFNVEDQQQKQDAWSVLEFGSDLYTLQVFNYTRDSFAFGMASRLEEVLPYDNNSYDYRGFYYLDFGVNFDIGDFNLGISIENFLNLDADSFSIDPIIEHSNGIVNQYYFSHETEALIAIRLSYTF